MKKLVRILAKPVPTWLGFVLVPMTFILLAVLGSIEEQPAAPTPIHVRMLTVVSEGQTVTVPLVLPTNIDLKLQ